MDIENLGEAHILGQKFEIKKSSLIFKTMKIKEETYKYLSIEFDDGTDNGWFFMIDDMPVDNNKKFGDFIGGCLHFEDTTGPSDDDTFNSDPNELIETSGWFFGRDRGIVWKFEQMKIDFDYLGGKKFRLRIDCTLYDFDDFDKRTNGTADVIVEFNEVIK